MTRPLSAKLLCALLLLLALLASLASFAMLNAAPDVAAGEPDAAKAQAATRIISGSFLLFAICELAFAFAIWRGSRVGWTFSVIVHSLAAMLFIYEAITASPPEAEDVVFAITPVVIVGLHFLPAVRGWTRIPKPAVLSPTE